MCLGELAPAETSAFHLFEESGHRTITVHLDWTRGSRQILRCFWFALSDHAGLSTSRTERFDCELQFLIIGLAPRARLHSVHGEIGISVVTRFVKLGQVSAFSLAQLSVFHATID